MSKGGEGLNLGTVSEFGGGIAEMFVNLSAEYPALLDGILILFAAAGVFLGASAAFDVIKIGKRDTQHSPGNAIFWKMIGSCGMIDLAFWAKVWTGTLWAVSDPMEISAYTGGGDTYAKTAMMAVIGFIVLAGYVTLGRAYLMTTKIGYLSPESRGDLIGSIIARLAAGSAMVAAIHISKTIENSTGFSWMPM